MYSTYTLHASKAFKHKTKETTIQTVRVRTEMTGTSVLTTQKAMLSFFIPTQNRREKPSFEKYYKILLFNKIFYSYSFHIVIIF